MSWAYLFILYSISLCVSVQENTSVLAVLAKTVGELRCLQSGWCLSLLLQESIVLQRRAAIPSTPTAIRYFIKSILWLWNLMYAKAPYHGGANWNMSASFSVFLFDLTFGKVCIIVTIRLMELIQHGHKLLTSVQMFESSLYLRTFVHTICHLDAFIFT